MSLIKKTECSKRQKSHPLISFPNTLKVFLGGPDPVATDRGLSGMNLGGTVLAVAAGRKTAGGGRRLVSGGSVGLRRSVKNGRMRGLEVDVADIVSPSPTASNGDSVNPAGNTIQRSAVIATAVSYSDDRPP